MGPRDRGRISSQVWHLLAGIEAGVLGGVVMFGWLALVAAVSRLPVWTAPNVVGSIFYGRSALQRGFGWATVSGLGCLLFSAGLVGMAFGILIGDTRNRLRVTLLGILAGLASYYGAQALFWSKLGVLASLYISPRALLTAHVLYGFVLGWYPSALRAVRKHLAEEAPGEPAVTPG